MQIWGTFFLMAEATSGQVSGKWGKLRSGLGELLWSVEASIDADSRCDVRLLVAGGEAKNRWSPEGLNARSVTFRHHLYLALPASAVVLKASRMARGRR